MGGENRNINMIKDYLMLDVAPADGVSYELIHSVMLLQTTLTDASGSPVSTFTNFNMLRLLQTKLNEVLTMLNVINANYEPINGDFEVVGLTYVQRAHHRVARNTADALARIKLRMG